jgi:hypothetical protein
LIGLVVILMAGCASISTMSLPQEKPLRNYQRAYIEQLPNDQFQLFQALAYELSDMGLEIVGRPFTEPAEHDLVVRYSFNVGWDFTKYLHSFTFQFIDATSGRLVASTSYRSVGLWHGVRDGRLETAFNDLRAKNGLPTTKQFK